jgi:hypothetical protein
VIRQPPSEPATALASNLRAQLLDRHRSQALRLVAEAMGMWREAGFLRYDNRENSCTIRVYACMLTLLEEKFDEEPVQIIPIVEGVAPTREQLAGLASVATAKRPDIVLFLGGNHAVRMCLECKRFLGSANAREYTENGILRFLNGQYSTDAGRGAMIGYVMTHSISARVTQVNQQIEKYPSMGTSHQLRAVPAIVPIDDVHVSTHAGTKITLTHLFLDMGEVVRTGVGLLKASTTTGATK